MNKESTQMSTPSTSTDQVIDLPSYSSASANQEKVIAELEEANKKALQKAKEVEETTSRLVNVITGFEERLKEMTAINKKYG